MSPVATGPTSTAAQPVKDQQEAFHTGSSKSQTPFPRPRVFEDKLEERAFLKFRLAQAFRIFGNLGFDEGVAGHITVRVRVVFDLRKCKI